MNLSFLPAKHLDLLKVCQVPLVLYSYHVLRILLGTGSFPGESANCFSTLGILTWFFTSQGSIGSFAYVALTSTIEIVSAFGHTSPYGPSLYGKLTVLPFQALQSAPDCDCSRSQAMLLPRSTLGADDG